MDITRSRSLPQSLGRKAKSLSESPTSRKIKEAATKIVEMMDEITGNH